jgi:isocitrate lyase
MTSFEQDVAEMLRWVASPRFAGIKRLYSAREDRLASNHHRHSFGDIRRDRQDSRQERT